MVPKCNDLIWRDPRIINENKGDNKSQQVSNQMKSITDDRDGVGNIAPDKLASDENEGDNDHYDQLTKVVGIVFFWRRFIQVFQMVRPLWLPAHLLFHV